MTGRQDWYVVFPVTPGLTNLNRYITQASKQIAGRHENITPSKVVAELTLGFWVSLLNSEYERLLWEDLRRAFPYLPKKERQRKNVSAPLQIALIMQYSPCFIIGIAYKISFHTLIRKNFFEK